MDSVGDILVQTMHRYVGSRDFVGDPPNWTANAHWGHCGLLCSCCRSRGFELFGICVGCETVDSCARTAELIARYSAETQYTAVMIELIDGYLPNRQRALPHTVLRNIESFLPPRYFLHDVVATAAISSWLGKLSCRPELFTGLDAFSVRQRGLARVATLKNRRRNTGNPRLDGLFACYRLLNIFAAVVPVS